MRRLGWHRARGPARVVSHASYLVNLASPDRETWNRSVKLMRVELERCEALAIPLLVVHPGSHLGEPRPRSEPLPLEGPVSRDERAGLARVVRALDRLARELPGYRVVTCLETTAGTGTTLGWAFPQLAWVRASVREPQRVAFCFDTCHVTAAGYDLRSGRSAKAVLQAFAAHCGLDRMRVVHMNDSLGDVGSRRDRHAHIGRGRCGLDCFRTIVNLSALARVPKIIETPKGSVKGVPWDVVNVRRLRRLIPRPPGSRLSRSVESPRAGSRSERA
jgi:deoxyribonuclease-4